MCGIAGFVSSPGLSPDPGMLRRMCDRIAHRGPDGFGQFIDTRAALGHRRLSIIDLAGGSQPMTNEDGSLQVVFNGEIYNYLELRERLLARGHVFHTNSDTEVLLHLYEDEGERMPEFLNGMFAFALWDIPRQQILLGRDRLGKKPLYYSTSIPGVLLAFASELKAICELPGFDRAVDPTSVADFLALSYVPEPRTIFRKVSKLPAGSTLLIGDGLHRERRYWALSYSEDLSNLPQVMEELDALSADSVARRMISDVPLGAFLSGGVDSSAVVAYMARHAPGRVKSFSIGFTSKEFDETHYARMVAERYQTDHHEETVTPNISEMLDVLVRHFDEPFGDSSAIPTLYLSRMTRQHVTVALSGDGADEMFGGYRRYHYGVLEERIRSKFPSWFRRSAFRLAGRLYPKLDFMPQVFRAKTLLTNLSLELGDAYYSSMSVFRDAALDRVLSPSLRSQMSGYNSRDVYRRRFLAHSSLPPLQQLQTVDVETYLSGDILVKADRATMAYSLEGRSPWLDYRIAEFAARMPAAWKIEGASGKHIFKKTVEPLLPADVLWRRKMGFSVPLAEWFRTSLKPVFEQAVLTSPVPYVEAGEARKLFEEHLSGLHNRDRWLWNLLMLSLWHREYGAH
ncbi:MAG: asparagine synthase (glutamine-hydrolyzing) [Acidobacteria bacterium]|nr:asparagine synthase (glutamine-hydrolyzing) [Acidobacteriota bacterium]